MQVKVFESEDMASALKKVKETLGPDALILSTRTIRKGGLGLLGKPIFEVTAAIEPVAGEQRPANASPQRKRGGQGFAASDGEDDLTYHDLWRSAEKKPAPRTPPPVSQQTPTAAATPAADPALASIRGEIDELKSLIQGFVRDFPPQDLPRTGTLLEGSVSAGNSEELLAKARAELDRCGLDAEMAETIGRNTLGRVPSQQLQTAASLRGFCAETIAGMLQVSGPIFSPQQGQKRLALIGPTGVGKTTTIAKLAADFLLHYGQRLALVTIDTYRIAAVEQLKVFGEIMGVPVEVVMSPQQLEQVFLRHRDKEVILIDTAGRSPKDQSSLQDLSAFLHQDVKTENHLVLSATTRETDLNETIRSFSHLNPASLIFTKLDECGSLGALINIHARNDYPLSYLTNGQRVPEDLLLAEPRLVAGFIMGEQ